MYLPKINFHVIAQLYYECMTRSYYCLSTLLLCHIDTIHCSGRTRDWQGTKLSTIKQCKNGVASHVQKKEEW